MTRKRVWVGTVLLAVVALNAVGIVRYPGGPLREGAADGLVWLDTRPGDQGSSTIGNTADAAWAQLDRPLVFSALWIVNSWPLDATVEAITPVDSSGDLAVIDVLLGRFDDRPDERLLGYGPLSPDQRAILADGYVPLPAPIPAESTGRRVALVVIGRAPGRSGFDAIAVDYRVGPFSFRVTHHAGLDACLGETSQERACDPES